jgi:hypothetical protein
VVAKTDIPDTITKGKKYTVIANPDDDDEDEWTYIICDNDEYDGIHHGDLRLVSRGPTMADPDFSLSEIHKAQKLVNAVKARR